MGSKSVRRAPLKGLYEDQFWEHVKNHHLSIQSCKECSTPRFPSGPSCPSCLSTEYEWSAISGKGRVLTWVVFRRQYFPEIHIPHVVAAVELDEGPIMIADLVDIELEDIKVGQRVEIIYEPVVSLEGKEWVIYHWKPTVNEN